MDSLERNELIDRIAKNAHVLGRMCWRVDKCEEKPWLMTDADEFTISRYYQIKGEQINLLDKLRGSMV